MSFRFGIRSLFVLTTIAAVACFAIKIQRDRAQASASALMTKRASIQNLSRGGRAQVVADGDYILLRIDSAVAVIRVKRQTMTPEQMECKWWYRDDGDGHIFASEDVVTNSQVVDCQLKFGTFDLEWSGSTDNWGWIYLHKHPDIKFKITRQIPTQNLDLLSDTIELYDLPEAKPYDKTIRIDWP